MSFAVPFSAAPESHCCLKPDGVEELMVTHADIIIKQVQIRRKKTSAIITILTYDYKI